MTKWGKLAVGGVTLLAAALRFKGLFNFTMHADEALFATWARLVASWTDPLLQSTAIDKPPLLITFQAILYSLLGPSDIAARMPNLTVSLLLIPVTARLAWQLYGSELAAVLAATFTSISPLAIQFSASAFTDPLLTSLLAASLMFAAGHRASVPGSSSWRGQSIWANRAFGVGLLWGLGVASKYQAVLFLPVLVGVGFVNGWDRCQWRRALTGALLVIMLLVLWAFARSGEFGLWKAQITSFGGLRLAWSWELWPRLSAWGRLWDYLLGSPVSSFALLLALPPFLAMLILDQDRSGAVDRLLVSFVFGYFLLHWLISVPVWDRYLLPIVPLVALLLARVADRLVQFVRPALPLLASESPWPSRVIWLLPLALLLAGIPEALMARNGQQPIGGQPTADSGTARSAAAFVDAPYGTVLYDHWYSWLWRYHLFGKRVYVSWFPHPYALAQDLMVFGQDGSLRYLALPSSSVAKPVVRAVNTAGFDLEPVQPPNLPEDRIGSRLFQIVPRG